MPAPDRRSRGRAAGRSRRGGGGARAVVSPPATVGKPSALPVSCGRAGFPCIRGGMSFSLGNPKRDPKVVRPFAFFRAGAQASAQNNRPILVMEDVYRFFRPDQPTLRDVNLTVER